MDVHAITCIKVKKCSFNLCSVLPLPEADDAIYPRLHSNLESFISFFQILLIEMPSIQVCRI